MKVTILTEAQIRQCVDLTPEALAAVEAGFSRLTEGGVTQPPIMRVDVPEQHGEVDIKSAYIRGEEGFAIKISSGFFDNARLGLPSLSGMMVLLSTKTGIPEAVLLDNGYLTDVRTGLAGAVAARYLAPERIDTVGVIGAGAQARYQIRALKLVRDFKRLVIYSRSPHRVAAYIAEMQPLLGIEIVQAVDAATLVQQSDLVVTTTPSRQPYLRAEWLHPGLHITAMGSDAEEKQELFPEVFQQADMIVCDRKSQSFRLGELHHAVEAGILAHESAIIELGELTSGRAAGRQHNAQITVCDLTGTGVQDTAIALLAYQQARAQGLGLQIENELLF